MVSVDGDVAQIARLTKDDPEDANAITESVQVADTVYARVLEAGDFCDNKPGRRHTDMDHCLDLKAVAPELPPIPGGRGRHDIEPENVEVPPPENIEPVAKI